MALPSSSSSNSRWKYDVFLSFRAETRKNFTDHLYAALLRAGINTYLDEEELRVGEEITPELVKAIEESRFSIIVFSKNYASSPWCLDELVHILRCRKTLGHAVWPVFYHVDPWKQKEIYKEAFDELVERFKGEMGRVDSWRDALSKFAELKGVDIRSHADGLESKNIDDIVKEISDRLDCTKLSVAMYPVGLNSRANEVISLLSEDSIEVCIVGIYGMGGIGKTTIAKEVYNSIFNKFNGSCFLANVRQKSDPKGMVQLQNQLLSEILKRKREKLYNVDRGLKVIEERLCCIRVLIVLDDVDDSSQLNKILGNLNWLFPGSRIIITTRMKDLLKPSKLYRQYKVKALNPSESLQLLSFNAFDKIHPIEDYMECAKSVVDYAGGIPLALEVLGSSLSHQSIDVWKSTFDKLKAIGDKKIHKVLEISYDSLEDTKKNLFLDIACFFIGMDEDYVISILDDSGFFAIAGINNLRKRCLVTVDSTNKLMMHDLLRYMGQEIVRRESPDPGECSRLWRHEDVIDVLTEKMGTKTVEGLILNLLGSSESLSTKAFKKMNRLRLLQLNHVFLTGISYEHISKKLRWLCWREFPLESIPVDLHMGNMVALDMRYSSLQQVWKEKKFLGKLKFLNLSHSRELTITPNFEWLPSLKILMLKDCSSLVEVHESIGLLASLVFLNLKDCINLRNLPTSICALKSLENFNISGCSKLEELPEELGNMKALVVLTADRTSISQVPETIRSLENLRILSFLGCPLTPSPRKRLFLISMLPASLKDLDLRYCNLSDDVIPSDLQSLPHLEDLKLCGNNFIRLPVSIGSLPKLRKLWLNECKRLQSVPELQSSVISFHTNNCTSLERINLRNFHGAEGLEIAGCHKLVEIEGYFNLEPIGEEIIEKLLRTHDLTRQESIASAHVHIINNLTRTNRISPLQALSESGIYSIFLPGSDIPSLFSHQSHGDSIPLNVPPLQGCKILGFIIYVVYAWEEQVESCLVNPHITVTNKTKIFDWIYDPKVSFFSSEVEQDIMWLSYWMFENNMEGIDEVDMGWRFQHEIEEGDQVEVSVDMGYGVVVKRCGVDMLYQQNYEEGSQSNDLAIISSASLRHHRRFLHSCPRWLTIKRHLAITSHKRIEVHQKIYNRPSQIMHHGLMGFLNADKEFERWANKTEEKENKRPITMKKKERRRNERGMALIR